MNRKKFAPPSARQMRESHRLVRRVQESPLTPMTPKRQTIEMADGRIYASEDNWITVYRIAPDRIRKAPEKEAQAVRLLVAYGAAQ